MMSQQRGRGRNLCVCVCVQDEQMPLVHLAVFIEHPTPFMEEFLERLTTLNYPHSRLRLFIHNNVSTHTPAVPPPTGF